MEWLETLIVLVLLFNATAWTIITIICFAKEFLERRKK